MSAADVGNVDCSCLLLKLLLFWAIGVVVAPTLVIREILALTALLLPFEGLLFV